MRSWLTWVVVAVFLAVLPAFAEKAKERDDSAPAARAGNHASSTKPAGAKPSSARVDTRVRSHSGPAQRDRTVLGGASDNRTLTNAQRRHPKPGTGSGGRDNDHQAGWHNDGRGHQGGNPYYTGNRHVRTAHLGSHYHDSVFFPSSCYTYWDGDGYWYGPRYYPYRYTHDEPGSVRLLVHPDQAAVYVDGYFAGIVDDFDGLFQRLDLPPGEHEIALKLKGYRTHRASLYAVPGRNINIRYEMVRGAGEDEPADLEGDPDKVTRDPEAGRDDEVKDVPAGFGTLELDIDPNDAAVYLDEKRLPETDMDIRLAVGAHRIEIARPGYRPERHDFEIRADKTTDLEIELKKIDED